MFFNKFELPPITKILCKVANEFNQRFGNYAKVYKNSLYITDSENDEDTIYLNENKILEIYLLNNGYYKIVNVSEVCTFSDLELLIIREINNEKSIIYQKIKNKLEYLYGKL